MKLKYVDPVDGNLANGRPLHLGDVVDLSRTQQDEPLNAQLVESGQLIPTRPSKPEPTPAPDTKENDK